ncbi:MAG TPA: hypothetical protein VLX91_16475 [Candidatus Acidoferrales bacterium]|nr:hypothetical protein [Candidatus Acidoferrales bacterium]
MKSIPFVLSISLILFTLSSCKKSNPAGPSGGDQIWPLKVGDSWTFTITQYDSTGNVTATFPYTYSVTGDTVVAGETWYLVSNWGPYPCTNRDDGLWEMEVSISGIFQGLLFKYPANTGDAWWSGADSVYVQSTSASITVPRGTYTCYEYLLFYRSSLVVDYYYCPGTGWIESDWYATTSTGQSYKRHHSELTSFTLK